MYDEVGDFHVRREFPTVQITRFLRNAVFFKSQNPRKAGPSVVIQMKSLYSLPYSFAIHLITFVSKVCESCLGEVAHTR